MERFQAEEQDVRRNPSITSEELRPLLERLHHAHEPVLFDPCDDHATVEAVCEATGEAEERVWHALEEIRREDIRSRLSKHLRELEEPLHRVERPGTAFDPLARMNFLDRLQKEMKPVVHRKAESKKVQLETWQDHLARWMAFLILLLMVSGIVVLFVQAISSSFR